MAARWYCVNTNDRREDLAARHLIRQGFTVMFPQFAHPRTRRMHPLFPTYLFLNFDPDQSHWQLIYSTPGVHKLFVRAAGIPLEIPQRLIDNIQEQISYAQKEHSLPALPQFIPGDAVEVRDASSSFNEFQGICQRATQDRVDLLISIFGRLCEVSLPSSKLVRV